MLESFNDLRREVEGGTRLGELVFDFSNGKISGFSVVWEKFKTQFTADDFRVKYRESPLFAWLAGAIFGKINEEWLNKDGNFRLVDMWCQVMLQLKDGLKLEDFLHILHGDLQIILWLLQSVFKHADKHAALKKVVSKVVFTKILLSQDAEGAFFNLCKPYLQELQGMLAADGDLNMIEYDIVVLALRLKKDDNFLASVAGYSFETSLFLLWQLTRGQLSINYFIKHESLVWATIQAYESNQLDIFKAVLYKLFDQLSSDENNQYKCMRVAFSERLFVLKRKFDYNDKLELSDLRVLLEAFGAQRLENELDVAIANRQPLDPFIDKALVDEDLLRQNYFLKKIADVYVKNWYKHSVDIPVAIFNSFKLCKHTFLEVVAQEAAKAREDEQEAKINELIGKMGQLTVQYNSLREKVESMEAVEAKRSGAMLKQ